MRLLAPQRLRDRTHHISHTGTVEAVNLHGDVVGRLVGGEKN